METKEKKVSVSFRSVKMLSEICAELRVISDANSEWAKGNRSLLECGAEFDDIRYKLAIWRGRIGTMLAEELEIEDFDKL